MKKGFFLSKNFLPKTIFMQTKFISTSMIKATLGLVLLFTFSSCKKDITPQTGPYDLDVVLRGQDKNFASSGFIKFRQDPDTARIITLDTWVSKLEANHSYLLQRAVNPITDSSCFSTAWLTLGNGLQPQAIHTDAHGAGKADLWRAVTAIARGTSFHIHFQVVDSASLVPVLTSECYDYTVR
jgi:hypothetical protein